MGMPQTNSTMRACHKQSLPRGMPNANKSGCVEQTTGWGCPTTLKEVGVCLVIPRKGYALKELKEGCWSKQTLGKGMN